MASSTTLQGPRDDNIVPLLHLTVFLCVAMAVMLFVEKVYMAIIILVKFFKKGPERHPERQYIWEPIREKDEIIVRMPVLNEKEVYQLSIRAACRVSWTTDRIIIQVLDDPTDPVIKEHNKEEEVMEDENERNQEEEIRTTKEKEDENERNQEEEIRRTTEEKEDENERNQEEEIRTTEDKEDENERNQEEEIRTTEEKKGRKRRGDERKSQAKRRKEGPKREGGSKVEATKDEKIRDRKQEETTGEGTVEVNEGEKEGREKKKAEIVSVGEVGEGSEEKGRWKRGGDTLRERRRWKRGGDTLGERKSQAERRKIADEGRKKRKQQCRWVRSCMAMGCAAIFMGALIYLYAANIPEEETIYLVPT